MSDNYQVENQVFGGGPAVAIERHAFEAAFCAQECLLERLRLEEVYDVAIENYAAIENVALSIIVDDMVRRHASRAPLDENRRRVDGGIVNLLSAARSFREVLEGSTKRLCGRSSPEAEALALAVRDVNATFLGFRAMTAVRNHVQHYGLAVHSVSYNGHWTGGPDDDSRKLRHQFTAAFGPWHLAADHKVDRALLAELEGRANQKGFVPLLPLIREYVEGLSELNHHSRELFAAREAQWKVELAALREAWAAERDSARHPGLTAVQRDEAGNCVREVPLEIELEERLEHLRRMNGRLHNLSRREIVA